MWGLRRATSSKRKGRRRRNYPQARSAFQSFSSVVIVRNVYGEEKKWKQLCRGAERDEKIVNEHLLSSEGGKEKFFSFLRFSASIKRIYAC